MTTNLPPIPNTYDIGLRLTDNVSLLNAATNLNGISRNYGISAAGTTQATATPLTAVINQLDTVGSSSGVNLPPSKGTTKQPYCFCIIINNGASPVTVYGAQGSTDTINGTAGSTGVTQNNAVYQLYASAKPGAWFQIA